MAGLPGLRAGCQHKLQGFGGQGSDSVSIPPEASENIQSLGSAMGTQAGEENAGHLCTSPFDVMGCPINFPYLISPPNL